MPKKATLPPGAAGRSQQTLARRNRRGALGKWLKRYAGVVIIAVVAWAAKTAWPRARRKLFPRKLSPRTTAARAAKSLETTAEAAAEWAVLQSRGDSAMARGAPREAVALYREAILKAPGLSPAYTNLCAALKGLGEYADAMQICTEGYAKSKDDAERAAALVNYGATQYAAGGARYLRSAIAAWSKASAIDPTNHAAHRYYARAARALGQLRDAAEAEKLAWTVDPRAETVLNLATLATTLNASTGDPIGVDLLRSGFGDPAALDGFAEALEAYSTFEEQLVGAVEQQEQLVEALCTANDAFTRARMEEAGLEQRHAYFRTLHAAVRAHSEVAGQVAQAHAFYREAAAALEALHSRVVGLANARTIERQELIESLQQPPPPPPPPQQQRSPPRALFLPPHPTLPTLPPTPLSAGLCPC